MGRLLNDLLLILEKALPPFFLFSGQKHPCGRGAFFYEAAVPSHGFSGALVLGTQTSWVVTAQRDRPTMAGTSRGRWPLPRGLPPWLAGRRQGSWDPAALLGLGCGRLMHGAPSHTPLWGDGQAGTAFGTKRDAGEVAQGNVSRRLGRCDWAVSWVAEGVPERLSQRERQGCCHLGTLRA